MVVFNTLNRIFTVWFKYPCFVCFRAFVDANMLKKRRQKVFDQLGGFSQQGAVCTILGKDTVKTSYYVFYVA